MRWLPGWMCLRPNLALRTFCTNFLMKCLVDKNSGQLLPEREGKHVGINNVYQRLILLYGNDFCIRFSGEKEGARVTVRLPAKRADEKE